jgi:hypothetical protein
MIRTGFAILAGAMIAAAATAQTQPAPQTPATSGTPGAQAQTEPLAGLPTGTAVNAQLNSSVDSKKAKVGDKVEARTTEEIKYAGKTIVPIGAKLEGHVTEATARSKGDSGSTLAIQFDKAIPKKGEEISLNVAILAIAAPQNDYSGGPGGPGSDPSPTPNPATGSSPMGTSHTPTATPGSANYPTLGADSTPRGMNGSAQLPANSRGVYGLKDLKLMASTAGASETTVITSDGKNVRLDSGTRLLLVAQTPTAAASNR